MCEYESYDKTPLDFLKDGLLVPEICEQLGITKHELFRLHRGDLITFVKDLVSKGKSSRIIAKLIGINIDSVKKLRHQDENLWKPVSGKLKKEIIELSKSGLNPRTIRSNLSIPIHRIYEALKNEIIFTVIKQNLSRAIKDFKIDSRDIIKIIKSDGFIIPSGGTSQKIVHHYDEGRFRFFRPISTKLRNVIEGELLGDGHIAETQTNTNYTDKTDLKSYKNALDNIKEFNEAKSLEDIVNIKKKYNESVNIIEKVKTSSFVLHKGIKELKWAEFIEKVFKENGYETNLRVKEKDCFCESKSSVQIQKIHEQFYNGKIKILPDNFNLNPDKVLHWYEGDGSYYQKDNRINFSTHNFSEKEVRRLSALLNREIGIHPKVNREHKRDGSGARVEGYYYKIYINRNADVSKFFQYLERADHQALEAAKKVVNHKFNENL